MSDLIEDLRVAWKDGQARLEAGEGWQVAEANARFLVTLDAVAAQLGAEHTLSEMRREILAEIAEFQPRVLGYIRANGFKFESLGIEKGNWEHLSFSLYSDICAIDAMARQGTGDEEGETGANLATTE